MKLPFALACVAVVAGCSSDKGGGTTGPPDGGGTPPTMTVSLVTPDTGSLGGGTAVTITGTNFPAAVDSVRLGTGRLTNLVRVSATQLTGTTPPGGAAGAVSVFVYTSAGTGVCSSCFSYTQPALQTAFPVTLGTRWLYADSSDGSYCDSYGCGNSARRDTILLVLDSTASVGGRSALRLRGFKLNTATTIVTTTYLSQDALALQKWDGATWRPLLSAGATWQSDRCWSMGYNKLASVTATTGPVTVPAGTFSTQHTSYSFQESGQPYTQYFLQESCSDYYADGVGLVRSTHNYSYHDVATTSSGQHGQVNLLAFNTAAPGFSTESEPNDTTTAAQLVALGTAGIVVEGGATPTDAAAIVTDSLVGIDTAGVRTMQDWYRLDLASSRTLTVILQPEDNNADFDLYLFAGTPPKVVASSLNQAGKREVITGNASAGTFYVGVQFWNRKAGAHGYWLYVK